MARHGQRRVVLGRRHRRHVRAQALPEAADFRHGGRPSLLGRRDDDRAAVEQIGPRVLGAGAMIAGQRMAADKPRPAPPAGQPGIDRRDDRLLRAAGVGDQRRRPGRRPRA